MKWPRLWLALVASWALTSVPSLAQNMDPAVVDDDLAQLPELSPVQSAKAIKDLWRDMRVAKNQGQYSDVCVKLDTLRELNQDISGSAPLAAYAYLVCARQKANVGDLADSENYLKLSVRFGEERPEHQQVRASIARQQGMAALRQGDLNSALTLLQSAYAKYQDPKEDEVASAALTAFAFEQHGRNEDVRALAALDAALLLYPRNHQAALLQRDIWMWDYGVWLVIAAVIFGFALYVVFRQWREVKIRETLNRGW